MRVNIMFGLSHVEENEVDLVAGFIEDTKQSFERFTYDFERAET